MNCCDYDCNQGRNCPVRQKPASVAKVGQRAPGPEPLRGPTWRDRLKDVAYVAIGTVVGVLYVQLFFGLSVILK